jgi:AbrB family looped-hinge helix DNA binding protein
VTLSSKGQLVIPATLRRLLGIGPGSRLSLKLEGKGLRMAVEPGRKTGSATEYGKIARKLSETAYAATEAAYAATDKAMAGEVDLEEFRRSAADARNRGLLALGVLNVEASAWQPAEGLVLSSDDRDRATTLSTRMSLIRQRMVDAEAWEPFIVAEMSANHLGSFDRAKKIIEAAHWAGASAVKLQTWAPELMVGDDRNYFGLEHKDKF